MRRFSPTNYYEATGRGLVWTGDDLDPPLEMGEEIAVYGIVGTVIGLERHAINRDPRPGDPVGVLLKPNRITERTSDAVSFSS